MAIDSRDKRFSLIGLASPFVRCLQNPTGTVGLAARQMLEFLYSGIAPTSTITTPRAMSGTWSDSTQIGTRWIDSTQISSTWSE